MGRKHHNPEKRKWKGISYKKNTPVSELKDKEHEKQNQEVILENKENWKRDLLEEEDYEGKIILQNTIFSGLSVEYCTVTHKISAFFTDDLKVTVIEVPEMELDVIIALAWVAVHRVMRPLTALQDLAGLGPVLAQALGHPARLGLENSLLEGAFKDD